MLTILGLIVGLVVSVLTKSSATLGFALENAVDGISSVLVLWRFWGGGKGQSEGALAMREKRASVGIAIVFVILAITVGTAGGQHLASHGELETTCVASDEAKIVVCCADAAAAPSKAPSLEPSSSPPTTYEPTERPSTHAPSTYVPTPLPSYGPTLVPSTSAPSDWECCNDAYVDELASLHACWRHARACRRFATATRTQRNR